MMQVVCKPIYRCTDGDDALDSIILVNTLTLHSHQRYILDLNLPGQMGEESLLERER